MNSNDNRLGITMLQCSSQDESLSDCSVMLGLCRENLVTFLSCDGSPLGMYICWCVNCYKIIKLKLFCKGLQNVNNNDILQLKLLR